MSGTRRMHIHACHRVRRGSRHECRQFRGKRIHRLVGVHLRDLDASFCERRADPVDLSLVVPVPRRQQPRRIATAWVQHAAAAGQRFGSSCSRRARMRRSRMGSCSHWLQTRRSSTRRARTLRSASSSTAWTMHAGASWCRMPNNSRIWVAEPGKLSSKTARTAASDATRPTLRIDSTACRHSTGHSGVMGPWCGILPKRCYLPRMLVKTPRSA